MVIYGSEEYSKQFEVRFEEGGRELGPRVKVPFLPELVKERYEECISSCENEKLTKNEIKKYCAIYSWQSVTGILPSNHHLKLLGLELRKYEREHMERLGYIKCRVTRGIYMCEYIKPPSTVCKR